GIRAQRAGLINRTGGRDQFHQVPSTAVTSDRKAPANHFAIRYQIRTHPQHFGHPTWRHPKSGNHLVKDDQSTVLACDLNDLSNELSALNQQSIVSRQWLQNYRGNLFSEFIEDLPHRVFVVQRRDESFARDL